MISSPADTWGAPTPEGSGTVKVFPDCGPEVSRTCAVPQAVDPGAPAEGDPGWGSADAGQDCRSTSSTTPLTCCAPGLPDAVLPSGHSATMASPTAHNTAAIAASTFGEVGVLPDDGCACLPAT
ncbi:hypothetical protein GCM10009867_25490 [Pedococcus aerophilus]|uniref:Uncharacterized protein n=1 Tax=Pedococcus aerophilus TaxID=436356 RepID=A0ABN3URE5_9MICO